MSEPLVRTENLHKVYSLGDVQVHALRGIDVTVEPGEFVAIAGASGSGKSTFMNVVGCLDRPTKGRYFLGGRDVSTLSRDELAGVRNNQLGFVFQSFNLLPRTSALENVELPLLYNGASSRDRHQRARDLLKLVGLEGREHHHPNQLSGGQQQRVAIARALVNRPSLLLADEPTGNLDTRTSLEIMETFQRLNQEQDITLLLVTHEADIASFASRLVQFRDGRVVQDRAVPDRRNAAEERASLPPIEQEGDLDDLADPEKDLNP
ncbi:MAG: ABC transporter ATP-binding protein [Vicinamibacteria bacterium]